MLTQPPFISVDGVLGATVSPLDRGLAYGDGLFETCRVRAGCIPLWPYHRERLQQGCTRLRLPLDLAFLQQVLADLLAAAAAQGVTEGSLKLILTRGQGERGYRLPEPQRPCLIASFYPASAASAEAEHRNRQGVTVRVCEQRLASNPTLAGIKHLNRLEYVLARTEWSDPEVAEGLLQDQSGRVIEGTVTNLFEVRAGRLLTPDLSACGVAGVLRRVVMEHLAPALQVPVAVQELTLADISLAQELFLCNSNVGIWPVVALDTGESGLPLREWQPGPVTRALQAELDTLWRTGVSDSDPATRVEMP